MPPPHEQQIVRILWHYPGNSFKNVWTKCQQSIFFRVDCSQPQLYYLGYIYLVDASKFPWFCKIKSPFIISYRFVCVPFFFSSLSWWNKTFQSCIFFVRLPVDLLLIVALLLYYQNNHLSMIPRYINFISNEESCKLLQAHPFWEFVTCTVVRMSLK